MVLKEIEEELEREKNGLAAITDKRRAAIIL